MATTAKSKSKAPSLRFAALIRVSSEGQADKKKESLAVQKQQIEQAVENLHGKIVAWYGGQEHATEGFEKKEIDRLLSDAQKHRFDAIICDKNDRWSRDNTKSSQGIDIFVEHGIRFFVGTTEFDLLIPEHRLFVEMNVVFASFQARSQKQRSLASRIKKAKRGCCSCGKKPYGRTWDKDKERWDIDGGKQAIIQDVAKRYLAGESMQVLADEVGMNHANLHKTLTQRCGDEWVQTFRPKHQPPEVVVTKIPELLDEETIKAIKEKAQANKTYSHGQSKNSYLLSRMIFCKHCGYAMFGQTNHREHERRYYRHAHTRRVKECKLPKTWIPADEIEESVMIHLFNLFGNPVAVQAAIEKAAPDLEKTKQCEQRLNRIAEELRKIERGRQRILDLILRETITQDIAASKLNDIKGREGILRDEQSRLDEYLDGRPSPEQIKDVSKKAAASIGHGKPFSKMTWKEKRGLVQAVFSGKIPNGQRMGVYITWHGKDWTFDILGHVYEWMGYHPLSEKTRGMMRNTLDEGGPVSRCERGQKKLLKEVSSSVCGCTAEGPP